MAVIHEDGMLKHVDSVAVIQPHEEAAVGEPFHSAHECDALTLEETKEV